MARFARLPGSQRRHSVRRRGAVLLLGGPIILATVFSLAMSEPEVLINRSASEPPGLYLRAGASTVPGAIVAFKTPLAAFPYADGRMAYLRRVPLLKAVAAGPGDRVCTLSGKLVINGIDRGPIASVDSRGVALPRWMGCRPMAASELFVFSDRVPNSFDSRYYGPVRREAVLGVYRLVLPLPEETV